MSAADLSKVREVVQVLDGELNQVRESFFELDVEFTKIAKTSLVPDPALAPRLKNDDTRKHRRFKAPRGRNARIGLVKRIRIDDLDDYVDRRRKRRLLEDENDPEILNRSSNGTRVTVTFNGGRRRESDGDKASPDGPRKRRSREEALAERRNDPQDRDRSKRMLGALLGTLHRFREEEQVSIPVPDDDQAEKTAEMEELARKERRENRKRRQQLITERNTKLVEMEKLEIRKQLLSETAAWTESTKPLANFIMTETKPHIFFKPKIPLPALETRQESSQKLINDKISEKCNVTMKTLDAFEEKVQKNWLKSSRIHSVEFDEKNLVKDELEEELEDLLKLEIDEKAHFNPEKIQNVPKDQDQSYYSDINSEPGSQDFCEKGEIAEGDDKNDSTEERQVKISSTTQDIKIIRIFSSTQRTDTEKEEAEAPDDSNPIAPAVAPETWNNAIRTKTLPSIYFMPKIPIDFAEIERARNKFIAETDECLTLRDGENLKDEETSLQITIFTGNDESSQAEADPRTTNGNLEDGELISTAEENMADDDIGDLQVTIYCDPKPSDKAESESLEVTNSTCNQSQNPPSPLAPSVVEGTKGFVDVDLMDIDDDIDYILEEYVDDIVDENEGGK